MGNIARAETSTRWKDTRKEEKVPWNLLLQVHVQPSPSTLQWAWGTHRTLAHDMVRSQVGFCLTVIWNVSSPVLLSSSALIQQSRFQHRSLVGLCRQVLLQYLSLCQIQSHKVFHEVKKSWWELALYMPLSRCVLSHQQEHWSMKRLPIGVKKRNTFQCIASTFTSLTANNRRDSKNLFLVSRSLEVSTVRLHAVLKYQP